MFRNLLSGSALALATAGISVAQAPLDRNELSPAARAALDTFNQPSIPLTAPVLQVNINAPADVDRPGNGEVLISGPLHEAFAEQFTNQPRPGFIVGKEPPQPVDEIPPEYRPDGYDIVWIPGYWGWDPERDNFVWVTGIWRQAPPDRNWVPGYWTQVTDGYQWISGFWAPVSISEIEYLPKPPDPIEAGPSSEPPSANHFWIPGQWAYTNGNYQWRAGYWAEGYEDWVWVPDRYVWTPGGYIYRTGYWDYLLADRGTIFCPIYWSTPQPNYRFQPMYVVNSGPALLANLFVNPVYHHYYFGNYYGNQYASRNIYPWVSFTQQSRLYDPLYGYYRTQYRDTAFLDRITRMHNYYAANPTLQPARTLAAQIESGVLSNGNSVNNLNVDNSIFQAVRLTNFINNQDSPHQLVQLGEQERRVLENGINPARELRQLRQRTEKQQATGIVTDTDGGTSTDFSQRNGGDRRTSNRWRLPQSDAGSRLGSIAVTPGNVTPNVDGSRQNNNTSNNRDGSVRGNAGRNDGDRDVARGDNDRERARTDGNRDTGRTDGNRDNNNSDGNNRVGRNDDNPRTPGERGNDGNRPGNRNPADANTVENPFGTSGLPGVTRPEKDSDRPGANTNRPDANKPDANRPDTNRPDTNRPDTNRPDANQPDTNRPDLVRPDPKRIDANRPDDNRPNTDSRGANEPNRNNGTAADRDRAKNDNDRAQPPKNVPDLTPNRPGTNPLNPNRAGDGNRQGVAPGEPNPSTPNPSAAGREPNRLPTPNATNPGRSNSPGANNAITDPAVRDDLRTMQDLSRREVERRRAGGNTRRPLPQVPGAGNPAGAPNPGGQNSAAPNSGVANPRTPGAGLPNLGVPNTGTPGASNPGSGARATPGPNRPNLNLPGAGNNNPGAAIPRASAPAGDAPRGGNPGARAAQRPVVPTPAAAAPQAKPARPQTPAVVPSSNPGRGANENGRSKGNNRDNKAEKDKKN